MKRIVQIDEWWNEFTNRQETINASAKAIYAEFRKALKDGLTQLTGENDEVNPFIVCRDEIPRSNLRGEQLSDEKRRTGMLTILKKFVTDQMNKIIQINVASNEGDAREHLAELRESWLTLKCYVEIKKGTDVDFNMTELQQKYINSTAKLYEIIELSNQRYKQLPEIQIPKFNGDPNKWKSFIQLFDAIIYNNDRIDDAIKIVQLKTSLTGAGCTVQQLSF